MIASLSGTVKALTSSSCVVDVNGFGMLVQAPARFLASITVGTSINIHTSLVVREDSMTLFGFETSGARDFFELLQTVSGIGPKVALSALSIYDEAQIVEAISNEDSTSLERIPGLGKKGAQRAVIELKDKVANLVTATSKGSTGGWRVQLHSALVGLGFTAREAEASIDAVVAEVGTKVSSTPIAELLKSALQNRGR